MRISLPPELPVVLNTEEPDPQPDEAKPVSRETVREKMLDILAKPENCKQGRHEMKEKTEKDAAHTSLP